MDLRGSHFSKMPVVVIIVYRILPQLLILFVFVMIIQHTIGSMREDAYRIAELTYRKEVDSATRLYNKNKYEDMLANYYTMVERVAVVLWDINNLKEINDRMGHGMGDKLIETMSGAIYAQTDSRKKAYRIGGDEFVMLIGKSGETGGRADHPECQGQTCKTQGRRRSQGFECNRYSGGKRNRYLKNST